MTMISHCCKTCPTLLTYELRTNRRVYCKPCKKIANQKSDAVTRRLRYQRYGRMGIRKWKELEQEERA